MAEADALLRAIQTEPDNDLHRLVYADWLDDHGDAARAEFIRLQCEVPCLPGDALSIAEKQSRISALLEQHGSDWFGALLASQELKTRIERGFVSSISGQADEVVRSAELIDRFSPVLRSLSVELWNQEQGPEPVLALPCVQRVRDLELLTPTETQLHAICRAPAWTSLDRFAVINAQLKQSEESALLMNGAPLASAAARVDYSFGLFLHDDLPPEESLSLLEPRYLRVLLELRLPNLRGFGFWGPTDSLARQLAGTPWFGRLDWLEFHCCFVEDSHLRILLTAPDLGKLVRLSLDENNLTDASAEVIAGCPRLSRLHELDLAWNDLTDRGAGVLAASPILPADLRISVRYNRMTARGAGLLRERFGAGLSFGKQHGERG
jgi:uncharacterized protein (TIGR02996 family)